MRLQVRPYVLQVLAQGIEPGPCHTTWPFSTGLNNRPKMRWNGQQGHVARFVLEQQLGRPLTASALHTCDNPPCWNPAHLYEGTQLDNMRDAVARGRVRTPKQRRSLTAEQVQELRGIAATGVTHRELGVRYGLAESAVWAIVRRLRYKDVA